MNQEITKAVIKNYIKVVEDQEGAKESFKKLVNGIKDIREVMKKDIISYNLFHSAICNFNLTENELWEGLRLTRDIDEYFCQIVYINNKTKTVFITDEKKQIEVTIKINKKFSDDLWEYLVEFYDNSKLNLNEISEEWNKEDFEGMTLHDLM